MARSEQVRRQWQVWQLLSACRSPLSSGEIAQRVADQQVTSRTVRRDLEVLRELGVPVRSVRDGRCVRYFVTNDGPGVRFDLDTLLALRLAVGLLAPFKGTAIGDSIEQLDRKLQATVSRHLVHHFASLSNEVSVRAPGRPSYADASAEIAALRTALAQRKVIRIAYRRLAGRVQSRTVHPQHLVYGPRGLYLLGLDEGRDDALRTFRVDRMQEVTVLGRDARREEDFDADELFAGSPGIVAPEHEPRCVRIRLRGEAVVRQLRENPWHDSQEVEACPGGAILSMQLTSTRELETLVLALGPGAELLEPQELRASVRRRLSLALARYEARRKSQFRSPLVRHAPYRRGQSTDEGLPKQ